MGHIDIFYFRRHFRRNVAFILSLRGDDEKPNEGANRLMAVRWRRPIIAPTPKSGHPRRPACMPAAVDASCPVARLSFHHSVLLLSYGDGVARARNAHAISRDAALMSCDLRLSRARHYFRCWPSYHKHGLATRRGHLSYFGQIIVSMRAAANSHRLRRCLISRRGVA